MASRKVSTLITLEGEAQYKQSVAGINNTLGALKLEMSQVQAEFKGSANSMDALRAKGELLNKQHAAQTEKVKEASAALEIARKAQQEYAAKVEDCAAKVAAAEARLQNLGGSAGTASRAQAEAADTLEKYRQELADAERYNEAAQKSVHKWQNTVNSAEKSVVKLNGEIWKNEQYLDEAKKSADGCAVSIDQYGKKTKEAAQKATTELERLATVSNRLNTMGNKLTAGLTVPLVTAGVAGVKFASDTDESMNKVEVAFGAAADGVKRWSTTTLNAIGLAQGTALDMAALFGDMGTSMGLPQEAAAEMSRTLVNLAADLASFKNISISEANTALKSIFTGETESLKNLGVVMTEANLKQYALAQGAKTAYEQMSQLEKVQLRYQYVLDMTRNAQGDFARTFDGTANQLRVCQESLKELAATAGDELLPIVTPMIANINGLLQSFGDLDEGTRKLVVQTALFLAALGPVMKVTAGATAGIQAAVKAYGALRVALVDKQAADAGATASQTALNAVMAANPAGALATAIGVVVSVMGSFILTAALTKEHTDSLSESLERSRQAYADLAAEIETKWGDLLGKVSALEDLLGQDDRSAIQQETLLDLVNQLNEAVPELALAYDQETGSLNKTTEAIRRMVEATAGEEDREAAAKRMADLRGDQAAKEEALAAAKEKATAIEAEYQSWLASGAAETGNYLKKEGEFNSAMTQQQMVIFDLIAAMEENDAELAALEEKYPEAAEAAGELTASMVHSAEVIEDWTAVIEALGLAAELSAEDLQKMRKGTEDQASSAKTLASSLDALSSAFAEQGKNGALSLDTTLKLIDAGYGAALSVDAETGAVRLNAEAYLALAAAKITEQMDTVQDSIRNNRKTALEQEGAAAATAAAGYLTLAASYQAAADAAKGEVQSGEALLATYQSLLDNLGKVAAGKWSGGGSRRSGGGKTNSAYKAALEELEYLRSMDEINEAEYYARLEALRDKYLKENSDEWRSATVKLHDYRKKAQEDAYNEELADAKYFRDMDLISEEEYYQRLAALRDKYLEEDSDAWRKANTELYDYLKKCRDEQLAAAKEGYEAQLADLKAHLKQEQAALKEKYERRKDEAKAEYEERKAEIQRELELEKERLSAIIDGIDREIQARRQLREDQDQDDVIAKARKRLEAARTELAFARTDEDRAELAKEVQRLEEALAEAIQDKEDTLFYRQKEAEKEEVRGQIEAAEKAADEAKDAAERKYQKAVDNLEQEYQSAVKRLEREYAAKAAQMEADYNRKISGGDGGSGKASRSGGAAAGGSLAAATAVLAGAMGAAAGAVTNSVVQHITRSNSASVTINEARSLTEGQVANTVRKVLNSMDR